MQTVTKVGLAIIRGGRLLLVRKRGSTRWILPGGRPEPGEDDTTTLARELGEELACALRPGSVHALGEFSDRAANEPDTVVTVRLYEGEVDGLPVPSEEIEELRWFDPVADDPAQLADSIRNRILPFLHRSGRLPVRAEAAAG